MPEIPMGWSMLIAIAAFAALFWWRLEKRGPRTPEQRRAEALTELLRGGEVIMVEAVPATDGWPQFRARYYTTGERIVGEGWAETRLEAVEKLALLLKQRPVVPS